MPLFSFGGLILISKWRRHPSWWFLAAWIAIAAAYVEIISAPCFFPLAAILLWLSRSEIGEYAPICGIMEHALGPSILPVQLVLGWINDHISWENILQLISQKGHHPSQPTIFRIRRVFVAGVAVRMVQARLPGLGIVILLVEPDILFLVSWRFLGLLDVEGVGVLPLLEA